MKPRTSRRTVVAFCALCVAGCGPIEIDGAEPKKLTIISIEPECAKPGEAAYIEGKGFGGKDMAITVGGTEAELLAMTSRRITFLVPEGIPAGPIEVVLTKAGKKTASIEWSLCEQGADVIFDVSFD